MGFVKGRVREVRLGSGGLVEVAIICPASIIPPFGQYLAGSDLGDEQASLATPLFAVQTIPHGFWAAPLHPVSWNPGTNLDLVGPLGHGFTLPTNLLRLGVVALGETVSRLLPLVYQTMAAHAAITLFTDLALPALPSAVEAAPLASLKDTLDWPDYLVIDLPRNRLDTLRQVLGLSVGEILPCPTQVVITTPMPCLGMAQCGACAVPGRRGWKLACEHGPVFDLNSLKW